MRIRRRRETRPFGLVLAFMLPIALWGAAFAQTPKIDNPSQIPAAVRPGAIEAQLEVEIAPGVALPPAIVSPYEPEQPANATEISFALTAVVIDGAQVFAAGELETLYRDKLGDVVRLSDIFEISRAITRRYADAGYPLSLAYVPAQEIESGVVRIRIIEGFIGAVDVKDAPRGVHQRLVAIGEKIMADRPLRQSTIERYLLLANEIPGVKVTGVLERGASAESGVRMTLVAKRTRAGAAVNLNNRASRAVGREQIVAKAFWNGAATGLDQLAASTVQSLKADELSVFSARYSTLVATEGLALSWNATRSEAAPGVPFLRDLGFETEGWTAGAGVAYPLVLSRAVRIGVSGGASWKEFRSAFGVTPNTLDRLWTTDFDVSASIKDGWDGTTSIAAGLSRGWDILGATEAGSPLASRAGAGGQFIAVGVEISRLQKINEWADMTVALKAQTANNPLLSSEQCGFGGAGFGRGYDPFEISGDRCAVALVEVRAAPEFLQRGAFKAHPFVSFDAGAVSQLGSLVVGERRSQSLYSIGAGARLSLSRHLSATTEVGVPLKGVVSQEGDDDPRFFFTLEARY
jgi:hemolysin activation/secretion protein